MMTTTPPQFDCIAERCDVFGCILAERNPALSDNALIAMGCADVDLLLDQEGIGDEALLQQLRLVETPGTAAGLRGRVGRPRLKMTGRKKETAMLKPATERAAWHFQDR